MEAQIKQADGLNFIGKSDSGHWVVMDGPEDLGGSGAGTRPMELLLVALGGCTGMDVVSLLDKLRAEYDGIQLEIEAEREDEHPKVFTEVHVKYKIFGDPEESKVEKAVEQSQEKYCSVSATLRGTAEVTYEYEIVE